MVEKELQNKQIEIPEKNASYIGNNVFRTIDGF